VLGTCRRRALSLTGFLCHRHHPLSTPSTSAPTVKMLAARRLRRHPPTSSTLGADKPMELPQTVRSQVCHPGPSALRRAGKVPGQCPARRATSASGSSARDGGKEGGTRRGTGRRACWRWSSIPAAAPLAVASSDGLVTLYTVGLPRASRPRPSSRPTPACLGLCWSPKGKKPWSPVARRGPPGCGTRPGRKEAVRPSSKDMAER